MKLLDLTEEDQAFAEAGCVCGQLRKYGRICTCARLQRRNLHSPTCMGNAFACKGARRPRLQRRRAHLLPWGAYAHA
jgi:hypothetical protein